MGLATYEIANEGEVDIQLLPKSKRAISTANFIEKIKPLISRIYVDRVRASALGIPVNKRRARYAHW